MSIETPGSISVVIPAYNAGRYLDEALDSIWRQTRLPQEIIVVDDCSTDGTADHAETLAQRSPVPLQVIRRRTNSGSPARPMNDGVRAARGEFICVLDQDDVWCSTKLACQHQALLDTPGASFAFSYFGILGQPYTTRKLARTWRRRLAGSMIRRNGNLHCSGDTAFKLFVKWENYVAGFPGFMFRRQDWLAKQGFDETFAIATDLDFLCWLCQRGSVVLIPETHFLRREHGANLTFREVPRLVDVIRILTRYITPEHFAESFPYRRVLGSKVLRLAQFFAYCNCTSQANRLLQLHYQIRSRQTDLFLKPLRRLQFAQMHRLATLLHFKDLRRVTSDVASAAAEEVEALLARHSWDLPAFRSAA